MSEKVICHICPKECVLGPGQRGLCRARINADGLIVAENYGRVTAMALDPIEKKPIKMYRPGTMILSIGSYGCNLRCSFCQNHHISMANESVNYWEMTPKDLAKEAARYKIMGNIGLAYTYNEPLVGYEFVRDCSKEIKSLGMDNIVVTNGYINPEPLEELLPLIDAFNIDLKAFNQDFYAAIGGDLETVKTTIALAAAKTHVELTSLIIQGENDSEEEMEEMAVWLASINPDIPLHLSRFFPAYKMDKKKATEADSLRKLAAIASKQLTNVFLGNI